MNKERLLEVADYIEQHPEQFDMSQWTKNLCNTACCIAGTAIEIAAKKEQLSVADYIANHFSHYDVHFLPAAASSILNLTPVEADKLFTPNLYDGNLHLVTPERAVRVLRRFAETGYLSWNLEEDK